MDEMNGNDNECRMPWPVRIALGWFVLLIPVALLHLPSANRWFAAFSARSSSVKAKIGQSSASDKSGDK